MLAEAALLAVLSVDRGSGAEACLDRAQLERKVERRLNRRVFVAEAEASLRVRVVFTAHDDRVVARIELSSIDGASRGTRSLVSAGHCSTLDDSLALSVALLVDEPPDPVEAPAAPPAPASTAAPPRASAPATPTRVITIPADVAAPREPWHVGVGVAGKGAWGNLPGVRPAAVLALTLVPRYFAPIRLQGEAFGPAKAERDASSGARFNLLRAGLALCPGLWTGSSGALGLCAGQQLGWLTVEGYGFDHNAKQQRRLDYSLTLGGEGRLRLFPPVSLRGYLGGEVPLTHDRFTSGGRNAVELFRPIPVTLVGEIGLEAALW
jgi:hypothetical protein